MSLREDSLLFILGAGASVDAGIKHAKAMTEDIETKIRSEPEFQQFFHLYNYLKSSIIYQRGLRGEFEDHTATIEELLVALTEIGQIHMSRLYPFIGSLDIHLLKVAGTEFKKVKDLDKMIRTQLFEWINITNYDRARYFCKFKNLVSELGSAVRIFTLNYDICVEQALAHINCRFELGFNDSRKWEAARFDSNENTDIEVYLYKLHGSIDWMRDSDSGDSVTICDSPRSNPELIFGTAAKLRPIDPYLFYVHELRKYSLNEALRFIVVIGYSFSDDYVNGLIGQAIARNEYLKILIVAPIVSRSYIRASTRIKSECCRIAKILKVRTDRILYKDLSAREFVGEKMKLEFFDELLGGDDDLPF